MLRRQSLIAVTAPFSCPCRHESHCSALSKPLVDNMTQIRARITACIMESRQGVCGTVFPVAAVVEISNGVVARPISLCRALVIISFISFRSTGLLKNSSTPLAKACVLASSFVTPVRAATNDLGNRRLRSVSRIFAVAWKPSMTG